MGGRRQVISKMIVTNIVHLSVLLIILGRVKGDMPICNEICAKNCETLEYEYYQKQLYVGREYQLESDTKIMRSGCRQHQRICACERRREEERQRLLNRYTLMPPITTGKPLVCDCNEYCKLLDKTDSSSPMAAACNRNGDKDCNYCRTESDNVIWILVGIIGTFMALVCIGYKCFSRKKNVIRTPLRESNPNARNINMASRSDRQDNSNSRFSAESPSAPFLFDNEAHTTVTNTQMLDDDPPPPYPGLT